MMWLLMSSFTFLQSKPVVLIVDTALAGAVAAGAVAAVGAAAGTAVGVAGAAGGAALGVAGAGAAAAAGAVGAGVAAAGTAATGAAAVLIPVGTAAVAATPNILLSKALVGSGFLVGAAAGGRLSFLFVKLNSNFKYNFNLS